MKTMAPPKKPPREVIRFPRRRPRKARSETLQADTPATLTYPRIKPEGCYYVDQFGVKCQVFEVWSHDAWWALGEGERIELTPGLGRVGSIGWGRMRDIPRREALADDPTPQPMPVHVERERDTWTTKASTGRTLTIRRWNAEDVPHCRLCTRCCASPSKTHPDTLACFTLMPASLTDTEAALYSELDEPQKGGGL